MTVLKNKKHIHRGIITQFHTPQMGMIAGYIGDVMGSIWIYYQQIVKLDIFHASPTGKVRHYGIVTYTNHHSSDVAVVLHSVEGNMWGKQALCGLYHHLQGFPDFFFAVQPFSWMQNWYKVWNQSHHSLQQLFFKRFTSKTRPCELGQVGYGHIQVVHPEFEPLSGINTNARSTSSRAWRIRNSPSSGRRLRSGGWATRLKNRRVIGGLHPTWWRTTHLVNGLVHPNYKWINPTYPM